MNFPFDEVNDAVLGLCEVAHAINSGGCGVVCSLLMPLLQPHVDDLRVTSCGWGGDSDLDLSEVSPYVEHPGTTYDWNEQGVGFQHMWVEFDVDGETYAIDCEGICDSGDMCIRWGKPYSGSFTPDEVERLAAHSVGWNRVFDRDQIPAMREHLHEAFARIFNNEQEVAA